MIERRTFLKSAFAAAAAAAFAPRLARAASARIDVLLDEPIGPITANLYGHFVEHLGGVVYDGVGVGEGSKIWRRDAESAAAKRLFTGVKETRRSLQTKESTSPYVS